MSFSAGAILQLQFVVRACVRDQEYPKCQKTGKFDPVHVSWNSYQILFFDSNKRYSATPRERDWSAFDWNVFWLARDSKRYTCKRPETTTSRKEVTNKTTTELKPEEIR